MKVRSKIGFCAAIASLVAAVLQAAESPRLELAADAGWRFFAGDPSGAETRSLQDSPWRVVDLPHD